MSVTYVVRWRRCYLTDDEVSFPEDCEQWNVLSYYFRSLAEHALPYVDRDHSSGPNASNLK